MSESKLIELGYYDPSAKIRLSAYADTVVLDADKKGSVICAIRFGGYPEMVRAMADAIYGGATIEATQNDIVRKLQSKLKVEMSRNVQSGNTQNLKSMVIQRSFPKWSVAERRKTAAASNQAAVCACAHSRYFAGGSPSGLRV